MWYVNYSIPSLNSAWIIQKLTFPRNKLVWDQFTIYNREILWRLIACATDTFDVNTIYELKKRKVSQGSNDSRILTTALPLNAVETENNSKYYTTCQNCCSSAAYDNQLQNAQTLRLRCTFQHSCSIDFQNCFMTSLWTNDHCDMMSHSTNHNN
jgi:hypothetical protein